MRWWGIALCLVATSLPVLAVEPEERARQLELWLEDPLDLRVAEASDLALLPWLDREEAERIVALRREGGLRRWSDLADAGLGAAEIDAIAPFVVLPAPGTSGVEGRVALTAGSRATAPLWGRGQLDVRAGPVAGWGRLRDDTPARWGLRVGHRWSLHAGHVVPLAGLGLVWDDPRARSGTRPVPFPDPVRLAPNPQGRLGVGAGWHGVRGRFLVWWLPGTPNPELTATWGRVRALGMTLTRGAGSVWSAWEHGAWRWRAEWAAVRATPGDPALRAASALRWREGPWRGSVALVDATVAPGPGRDPISGGRLDRPHAGWQGTLRRSGRAGSWAALYRELQRDGRHSQRLRLELAAPLGPGRARIRSQWEDADGELETRVALEWEDRTRGTWRRRIVVRRSVAPGRRTGLLTLSAVRRGPGADLRARIAFAGGDGSSYDAMGVPGGWVLGQWLAPGSTGLWLGVGRLGRRVRLGVGLALEWNPAARPERSVVARLVWSPARDP